MKEKDKNTCGTPIEKLMLLAYEESDDPEVAAHAKKCGECCRFIKQVNEVRKAARAAGAVSPPDRLVQRAKKSAMEQEPVKERSVLRFPLLTGRGKAAWAAAAMAVLAAGLSLLLHLRGQVQQGPPDYLVGITEGIYAIERDLEYEMDEAVLGGGPAADPLGVFLGEDEDFQYMEVAMLEIEREMGYGEVYEAGDALRDYPGSVEEQVEEVESLVPLLPGFSSGASL